MGIIVGLLMALVNVVGYAISPDPVYIVSGAFCLMCALISAVISR